MGRYHKGACQQALNKIYTGRDAGEEEASDRLKEKKGKVMTMELIGAIGNYLIRLVMFTAVAAAGIAIGIKARKIKNQKEEQEAKN
jgi:hypothetical protein